MLPKLVGEQAARQEVSDVNDVSGSTTVMPATATLGNLDAWEHLGLRHR
ncbi:MAG TPA: hypothetical protein VF516_46315 [Kofleriaceae bacterium]